MQTAEKFGNRLRELRSEKGFSQQQLAEADRKSVV